MPGYGFGERVHRERWRGRELGGRRGGPHTARTPGCRGSGALAGSEPGGRFFALTRSWATGALVYIATGFLTSRVLLELLGNAARLESFGWRLCLLHIPALAVTLLTVLAATRMLPDEYRASRALYLLAALTVPLAGMAYGFAVSWEAVGIEGALMPVVALAAGAASGTAVDRLWRSAPPGPRRRRRTRTTGVTAASPRRSTSVSWSSWRP